MNKKNPISKKSRPASPWRRRLLKSFAFLGGGFFAAKASAHHTDSHFEKQSKHKIVYQCNKANPEYLEHVLFSISEMIRTYGDDIEIVVAVFGEAIHILGKHPLRPIPESVRTRIRSLSSYGVSFHACGNTMMSLKWTEKDMFSFAKVVRVGVDDIMQLQEQGFTYFSW